MDITNEFLLWCLNIVIACLVASLAGYNFIILLRNQYKKTGIIVNLTILVYVVPIIVFIVCLIMIEYGLLSLVIGNSISFGTVVGIIIKLSSKPQGSRTVRLIVKQVNTKSKDIWLDSMNVTVLEIKNIISDAFSVKPARRIILQNGKGSAFDDLNAKFIQQLDDTAKSTDFFGYFACSCYITILEPIEEEHTKFEVSKEHSANFKLEKCAKYGETYTISARSAASDDANKFHICEVDKFAGAAPGNSPMFVQLKILAWRHMDDSGTNLDTIDDGTKSEASVATVKTMTSGFASIFKHKAPKDIHMKGKPIMHGDLVIIESDGKFMSVSRGWWLSWSSSEPRHSGCFEIEIVQRDMKKFLGFKTSSRKNDLHHQEVDHDPGVRPGDFCRLKSVKFPGYELGITSVKLKDEYYYLGLRKIGTSDAADDAWCMTTLFCLNKTVLGVHVRG